MYGIPLQIHLVAPTDGPGDEYFHDAEGCGTAAPSISTTTPDRMVRPLTSLLAAIALLLAVVTPPAFACESGTKEGDAARAIAGSGHTMDDGTQTDCAESEAPATQEHDGSCLVTCLTMTGCSSPCFVVEVALATVVDSETPAPASSTEPHLSRSSAPDRPPPRA